jgi:hypothetical protein
MKIVLFLLFIACLSVELMAQACCSAGTPMLGSLETSTASKNTFQLNLTYDFNSLQSVLEGSKRIDDKTRERSTHSALIELTYGLTDKFSFTGLFTYANQRRSISSLNGNQNLISSFGFGDALLLVKYELISQNLITQTQLAFGAGPKIPLGKSDLKNNGILLPADIQPGSGSLDFVFWGFYSKGFMPSLPLNIFTTLSYKINTENKRFANFEAGYKFGNEFVASIGAGYRTDYFFDYSLSFRFRSTAKDKFDNENVPNTGGFWIYAIPGLNLKITDQFTTRFTGQIPVFRYLEGTQLTTTYTLSISFFYNYSFQ